MKPSLIIDIVFAAILVLAMVLGAKRGFFRAISGIAGTVIGFIGAEMFCTTVSPLIKKPLVPLFESIFAKTQVQEAIGRAISSVADGFDSLSESLVDAGLPQHLAEMLTTATQKAGCSVADFGVKFADGSLAGTLGKSAAEAVAPVLTFILLFVILKLLVSLVCRLLSANIPVVRTVNRAAGILLGLMSGLLLLVLLCWGVVIFAPEGSLGIFSRAAFENSLLGGFIMKLFG